MTFTRYACNCDDMSVIVPLAVARRTPRQEISMDPEQ